MRPIDTGTLLLTNQRILFVGSKRAISAPVDKIVQLDNEKDAEQRLTRASQRPASTLRDEIVADYNAGLHYELDSLHLGYVDCRVTRNCNYIGELAFLD